MSQKNTTIGKHLWRKPPSCLDAAYERQAVEQGYKGEVTFPENILEFEYVGYVITEEGIFSED